MCLLCEISSILSFNPSVDFHFCHHIYAFLIPESSFILFFFFLTMTSYLFFMDVLIFELSEGIDRIFEVIFSLHDTFSVSWLNPACVYLSGKWLWLS